MASKQEMIKEMVIIADQHEQKKQVITKILDDLDKKPISEEHVGGVATVNQLVGELEELEGKYIELTKKIKE